MIVPGLNNNEKINRDDHFAVWMFDDDGVTIFGKCSFCGKWNIPTNYCPYCGAYMFNQTEVEEALKAKEALEGKKND